VAAAFDSARGDRSGSPTTSVDVVGNRQLHRWEQRCRRDAAHADAAWPQPQALALVDAILEALATNETAAVDAAARAWARVSASVSTLVRQMGALREVLASDEVCASLDLDDRLGRIVDRATTTATAAALAELEDAALTDALTGVGNRRALETAATAALASADRADHVVSVVVVDLDGLKAINDTRGHAAGDQAIAGLTDALRRTLRDSDQLFRIGGDEFVALLPMAPVETVTELMRRAAGDAPSFSWGVATAPDDGDRLEDLLESADRRLYETRRRTRVGPPRRPGPAGHAALTGRVPAAVAELAVATATAPAPSDGSSPARGTGAHGTRRRRDRRVQIVAAALVTSAALGVVLHVLTEPATNRPGHVAHSPYGTSGGKAATPGGTPGTAPVPAPSDGSPPARGTGASAGHATGTDAAGTTTGPGTDGTASSGASDQGAGDQASPPGTTTTTAPSAPTTVPGLEDLGGTTVPTLPPLP